ncbi:MAG: ArsS family sensor histidine kinase [Sulfuricurvum sp.]|uniref:ArsS family sensor histidine kinase n=1 Tax=Sulfuricurvum sp. TaxID=2025608 RepID=UPI00260210B8|nr:ArsS family sensor histidine kinase [Sulfuricurvum sp.]MDD5118002.1 ArsS family sensor histidine kinase [Sulfuricurvum sp.]
MNKHSILRLISLFFLFIFALINALFWIAHQYFLEQHQEEQLRRFLLAEGLIHLRSGNFDHELQQLMIRVSFHSPNILLNEGTTVRTLPFGKMIEYHQKHYFVTIPPPKMLFDRMNHEHKYEPHPIAHREFNQVVIEDLAPYSTLPFWSIIILVDLLILLFFAYLVRKLLPLQRLKDAIIHFKEGDTHLKMAINGQDEIAQITQEFNLVLQKIASMKEARSLFLRNVLHELKTPIMKGSLSADCLDSSEDKERLKRIFNRMDYLLNEFSKMEQFSSGEWYLNLQEYRFVDILDHTCDVLLCDKKDITVKGEDSALIVKVDFELFAIALKNLLDNAFKYSRSRPTLLILSHSIELCSLGEPLPDENRTFSKPFNRTYESSMNGLGLGLYITNAILLKHGFKLEYHYLAGMNCFRIRLH